MPLKFLVAPLQFSVRGHSAPSEKNKSGAPEGTTYSELFIIRKSNPGRGLQDSDGKPRGGLESCCDNRLRNAAIDQSELSIHQSPVLICITQWLVLTKLFDWTRGIQLV